MARKPPNRTEVQAIGQVPMIVNVDLIERTLHVTDGAGETLADIDVQPEHERGVAIWFGDRKRLQVWALRDHETGRVELSSHEVPSKGSQ